LSATEPELLDRALVRLSLLIGSEDDRVALRAVKEVLDRTLGRPRQRPASFKQRPEMDAAMAAAREKLAALIEATRSERDLRLEGPEHLRKAGFT
jgi:hypothetical protein